MRSQNHPLLSPDFPNFQPSFLIQIKGLGLDALFGDTPTTGESVAIDAIKLPQQQPRRYFDPQKLQQLVQSVKEHSILERMSLT